MPRIQFITDIAITDFYPVGSPMPGRNSNPDNYRFGFNGKENQSEFAAAAEIFRGLINDYD
ncbi:MAG: hypothetical protein A2W94_09675 [Bacteroidetes bacterium GWE2_42_42]|nr:MAG: hypothetical protein A2W94_09675 [Bacteroidetes bacterium GWE2_42_42]HCB62569.1 hypothetical protein [Bacteroidales bacterium]